VIINASKNVFGPGKDFGAYSASKAAGHQLGKVAAIELAPHNIRVNMINADAVFGDEANPSGLWQQVGPQRAQSRHIEFADLPEYYRQRNLLKARVHGRHVGNAVVFFASNATPTTGATLPVDGGVVEAFPR
jgi:NAD(P)-dependent dehydrogenase (short-subunit alcohol dehydrogenase family)